MSKISVLVLLVMFAFSRIENIKLFSNTEKPVINAGIGGNTTTNLLKRIDKDVLEKKPELVIMMIGTNDMLNSKKMVDYKTYSNNLETLIKKIKLSGSNLVLMSPIPVDEIYLLKRHDKRFFNEAPNEKIDRVCEIVKGLAMKYTVHYYNLNNEFKVLNLPQHNQDIFIKNEKNSGSKDGVHPTALGYRFIAHNVYYFLLENNLLSSNQQIICFGDSITRGGTKGESYPAYLNELIVK